MTDKNPHVQDLQRYGGLTPMRASPLTVRPAIKITKSQHVPNTKPTQSQTTQPAKSQPTKLAPATKSQPTKPQTANPTLTPLWRTDGGVRCIEGHVTSMDLITANILECATCSYGSTTVKNFRFAVEAATCGIITHLKDSQYVFTIPNNAYTSTINLQIIEDKVGYNKVEFNSAECNLVASITIFFTTLTEAFEFMKKTLLALCDFDAVCKSRIMAL
jgi:hypothetical protein